MENKVENKQTNENPFMRFRCHKSIMLEQLGSFFWTIIFLLFISIEDIDEILGDIEAVQTIGKVPFIVMGILIIGIIFFVIAYTIWYRTIISIEDNTLIWERNIISRKKKSIAIQNISNINTEQNIFEMILGTCKVKLDTDTLSTADTNDFKIILKKDKALKFKNHLLMIIKQLELERKGFSSDMSETNSNSDNVYIGKASNDTYDIEDEEYDYVATSDDVIKNGICSISIFSVLLSLGLIVAEVIAIISSCMKGITKDGVFQMLGALLVGGIIIFNSVYSIINNFIKYQKFSIRRRDNKIQVRYGLVKKRNYSIPVKKINAIQLKQTLISRIFKKYCVEVINVGLGDEENEENTYILLYDTLENIQKKLHVLLPEFDIKCKEKYEKQPKVAILHKIIDILIVALGLAISAPITYMIDIEVCIIVSIIWGIILIAVTINQILSLIHDGIYIGDKYLQLVEGRFAKSFTFIPYNKIQYITSYQGILDRMTKVSKFHVNILATLLKRKQISSIVKQDNIDKIREKILAK